MHQFDLFEFYRFILTVLVGTYSVVRLATLIWRWQGFGRRMAVGSPVLHRYFLLLLVRTRFRRFVYELFVVGGLAAVLALLIRWHW